VSKYNPNKDKIIPIKPFISNVFFNTNIEDKYTKRAPPTPKIVLTYAGLETFAYAVSFRRTPIKIRKDDIDVIIIILVFLFWHINKSPFVFL
jgi:hypothetical protein